MRPIRRTTAARTVAAVLTALLLGALLGVVPASAFQDDGAPAETAAQPGEPRREGASPSEEPATGEEAEPGAEPGEEAEPAPEADPAADFYVSRCAGCHTVGGGELTAPDLLPATGWPEADLTLAVERMEKNVGPLTEQQVGEMVDFLKSPEVQPRIAAARERQVQEMAATLEPPSPATGRALFHGEQPFARGGMPCAACHRAGDRGGTLAADLTDAWVRLGESALLSASESPGFPLMRAAYGDHPVSRQEAVHLVAYLEQVAPEQAEDAEAKAGAESAAAGPPVGTWGTALAVLVLLTLALPLVRSRGRRRLAGRGVRAELVEKARRS